MKKCKKCNGTGFYSGRFGQTACEGDGIHGCNGGEVPMVKKKDNSYTVMFCNAAYGREFQIRAKDIFIAIKKASDIIKQRILKDHPDFEKDGQDIPLRIWRDWE